MAKWSGVVPKGVLMGAPAPTSGLRACCQKPFDDSAEGNRLLDGCGCGKGADTCALVECVSCDMRVSGQHACSMCRKIMCNFCGAGEEEDSAKVCKLCRSADPAGTTGREGDSEQFTGRGRHATIYHIY